MTENWSCFLFTLQNYKKVREKYLLTWWGYNVGLPVIVVDMKCWYMQQHSLKIVSFCKWKKLGF